jgi:hypothetical protein
LQHSDERPPSSGRPSLLSLDQQAEADRHRILTGLDGKPAGTVAGKEKARRRIAVWLVAGAVVLALGAGAGMWLVNEGEKEIVSAGTAPLPATPAPAAALATEPVPVRGTADEVSSAAILDEAPVIADKAAPTADAKEGAGNDLTKMLEHGMPAAPAGAAVPPLVLAEGQGAAAPVVAARPVPARAVKPVRPATKAPAKKTAAKPGPNASNVAPRPRGAATAAAKKKPEVHPKADAAPVDSDVALLAALVAHSKATQPKGSTGVGAKLKQCKSLGSAAEASQCRARVCSGAARNEAECRASNGSKASSGTQ